MFYNQWGSNSPLAMVSMRHVLPTPFSPVTTTYPCLDFLSFKAVFIYCISLTLSDTSCFLKLMRERSPSTAALTGPTRGKSPDREIPETPMSGRKGVIMVIISGIEYILCTSLCKQWLTINYIDDKYSLS